MTFAILRWLIDLTLGLLLWDSLATCHSAIDVLATLRDMTALAQVGFVTCAVVIAHTMMRITRAGFAAFRTGEFDAMDEEER